VEAETVSVRLRTGEQLPPQPIAGFVETVSRIITEKSKNLV
jgi:hypothetical protein